jgi:flagellar biosynthesis chaperone FliJ
MTKAFSDLRDALQERLNVVADHDLRNRDPQAHLSQLKSAASRLDAAIAQLPAQCDPNLRHYLNRQSYLKALAWLENQD